MFDHDICVSLPCLFAVMNYVILNMQDVKCIMGFAFNVTSVEIVKYVFLNAVNMHR